MRFRDPQAALALAREAVLRAPEGSAESFRGSLLLASCRSRLPDEVDAAFAHLERLLDDAADDAMRCAVLHELGENRALAGKGETASALLIDALALARERGLRALEVRILSRLGSVRVSLGSYRQGLSDLLTALRLREGADRLSADPRHLDDAAAWELGTLHGRIGVAYSNLDDGPRAIAQYESALACFSDRFPLRAGRTLYRMGIAAEEHLADLAAAESYYRRASDLLGRHGSLAGRGLGLAGVGRVLLERGDFTEAETTLDAALEALEGDPAHRPYVADVVRSQGQVHLALGRPREALACFERALPLFQRDARPAAHLAALHQSFYEAHRALGDLASALRDHERFHTLQIQHERERADWRVAEMIAHFDTERLVRERELMEKANRELHDLTIRDPLTGLFNRRHLDDRLAEAFALSRRSGQPLSVMICDVDDFKAINDRYSHQVGDEVLRRMADALRQHVRQSDVVARFGGEEFVVVFPGSTPGDAALACEKLRVLVETYAWSAVAPGLRVTLSAGVAAIEDHAEPAAILRTADRRLYEAKSAGKNRVIDGTGARA